MNVLNYPAFTSWTEVCVQMHQKCHFNHPCCRSSPGNLLESSPNMDNRIKTDCFSEQSSREAGRLWPNFLWWQFSFDVMRWDLTPANAASFLTVLLTFIGWLWIICCRVILVVWSKLCFQRLISQRSPSSSSSSRGRSSASVPQLSPSLYLRCAEFTGCCSGLELQTLLMRRLMKAGAHSKSIPLQ